MAAIKVLSPRKNVQDSGVDSAIGQLYVSRNSSLQSLVLVAGETNAFPGTGSLGPLCQAIEILGKKLDQHAAGKLPEDELLESIIYALNVKEDKLPEYQRSLSLLGPQVPDQPTVLSIDELKEIFCAVVSLDNGLRHYIEQIDSKVALDGIKQFRNTVTYLIQNRLDSQDSNPKNFN